MGPDVVADPVKVTVPRLLVVPLGSPASYTPLPLESTNSKQPER